MGDKMEEKKQINVTVDHGEHAFFTDNVTVLHNPNKFVIDFTQTIPKFDNIAGKVQQTFTIKHKTVILDPQFAKIFLNAFQDNVKKYEDKFGKIKLPPKQEAKEEHIEVDGASRYIG